MTVRRLCILASLSAVLFVQEEVLTFIPNVQFTFLLILLYGALLKPSEGTLIVFIHVLLDNLFMNSLNIYVVVPMLIGHEVTLLIGHMLKNKNEFLLSIGISVSSIIYAALFFVSTVLFFDIKPVVYLVQDIPFDVVLVACNVICVLFLYKPLYKFLDKLLNTNTEEENVEKME